MAADLKEKVYRKEKLLRITLPGPLYGEKNTNTEIMCRHLQRTSVRSGNCARKHLAIPTQK